MSDANNYEDREGMKDRGNTTRALHTGARTGGNAIYTEAKKGEADKSKYDEDTTDNT